MPRDYAAPRRKKKKPSPLPGGFYLLMGFIPGVALAAWLWFKPAAMPPSKPAAAESASEETRPAAQEPRFTFYHELPAHKRDDAARSAPPPTSTSSPPPKPAPPAPPAQRYAVQAGSYQQAEQADEQKAKLAMLGFSARVEPVKLDASSTYYRVRIGPYASRAGAEQVMAELAGNSVDAAVIVLP